MKKFRILKLLSGCTIASQFLFIVGCKTSSNQSIAILYTNDVHTALEPKSGLSYSVLKGYRNNLQQQGYKTLLVDSGDFISGGIYGTFSKGQYIVNLMNACEYDLCTCGNHEFDYGMARFYEIKDSLKSPIISSNFYHMVDNERTTRVLDDTRIINIAGKKIGFIGITTPDTITSSSPSYFQDDQGNLIYSFSDQTHDQFYKTIQDSVDSLTIQKCDKVIALSHLGEGDPSNFSEVKNVISHTSGIDVFLDGHSHTLDLGTKVKNKDNKDVFLTQTGTGLAHFGQLTIDKNNNVSLSMINSNDSHDEKVDQVINNIKSETDKLFKQSIGSLPFKLRTNDDNTGQRLVRKEETNLGDFLVDAFKNAVDDNDNHVDFAIVNSGGIRAEINSGNVTIEDFFKVLSFANQLCKAKIKGQAILDALEYSVSKQTKDSETEFGGFLQVSDGIKFSANLSIDSPVEFDNKGFIRIDSTKERRVQAANVFINNIALDVSKEYIVASTEYTLKKNGDGYNMWKNNITFLPCKQLIDIEAAINYFKLIINDETKLNNYKESQQRIILNRN